MIRPLSAGELGRRRFRFIYDADFSPHWAELDEARLEQQWRHRLQRYTWTKDGRLRYQPTARTRIETWRPERQAPHVARHHR